MGNGKGISWFVLLWSLVCVCLFFAAGSEAGAEMEAWSLWDSKPRAGCNGLIGECFEDEEMLMDSEINRRILAGKTYISYGALRSNSVPCSRRGASYYNCRSGGQANPYGRSCTQITRCARSTS